MKSYLKVALVATMALMPCTFASAALSGDVESAITTASTHMTDEAQAQLIAALASEMKSQGLDQVSAIAQEVMASATSEDIATALAEALTAAAIQVAADLNVNAADLVASVISGISNSTSAFNDTAITASRALSSDFDAPSFIDEAGGDASLTPAVDASASTGVGGN